MQYIIMFAFACALELLGTLYLEAWSKKNTRWILAISLVDAIVSWAPLFLILYLDDMRMFPFAVVGQVVGTASALRLRR